MFRMVVCGFLFQLVARLVRCVHVFVSNYNINSELFQTPRSVHKHRVCLYTRRFGKPCFQRFEFVGFARFLLCLLYDS